MNDCRSHAFFTFGRFQPPTLGHALVIDTMIEKASLCKNDVYVFVSSTQNADTNPLKVEDKIKYLKKMHDGKPVHFINTKTCCNNSIFSIIKHLLYTQNYRSITMVIGSDRVETFRAMFAKYPGYESLVSVEGAGDERTEDVSKGVSAISGTLMRKYAKENNFKKFKDGVFMGSMTDQNAQDLMHLVREGLNTSTISRKRIRNTRKTRKVRKSRKIITIKNEPKD
jgi:nicotinic acid mononucleotide adenylyltransferase